MTWRAVIGGLLLALAMAGCSRTADNPAPAQAVSNREPASPSSIPTTLKLSGATPSAEMPAPDSPRRTPVVRAVQKASPSVVNIGTERFIRTVYNDDMMRVRQEVIDQLLLMLGNQDQQRETSRKSHSLGSGVIIDEDGYILTNYHVIDRADRVHVMLNDGQVYDAIFVAGDEVSDLALIKINVPKGRKLTPAEFAPDDDLLLGEPVIAMGNPYGLSHTVSVGVLSATNREATWRGQTIYRDILQTDAAVNPGSSGGPLINVEGRLIGINVAIFQEAQNIGFAVPVRRARALLGRWMSPSTARNLTLGMEMIWEAGKVRVSYVDAEGSAAAAGLRRGAIIEGIAGHPANDLFALNRELLQLKEGQAVAVTWNLDGHSRTSNLKLQALEPTDANRLAQQRLGLTFQMNASAVAPIRFQYCLPVANVRSDGPAARSGLTAGRYIARINETAIRTLDDVGTALADVNAGDPVTLTLIDFSEKESMILAHLSSIQLLAD